MNEIVIFKRLIDTDKKGQNIDVNKMYELYKNILKKLRRKK